MLRRLVPAVLACLLVTRLASAESAAAETLFSEGKRLMDEGRYALACPKLAESYRLDPGTGALLALALCYERAGKFASAWGAYNEAAARSKTEKRPDRESAALERAAALEPKMSKLTIEVSSDATAIRGLVVKRDGAVVVEAAWGEPVPVDPGDHVIVASAPGYRTFEKTITVGTNATRARARVPALEPVASSSRESRDSTNTPSRREGSNSIRTIGIVTGAVGVLALGVGTYFAVRAKQKNDDSKADCDGNVCGPDGKSLRNDARRSGNIATGAFIGGAVLVATGITLFVIGSPSQPSSGYSMALGGRF